MRILLVEDNKPLSEWLSRTLEQDRYVVECTYDGEEANYLLCTQAYDLVILDLALPRMGGAEVLRRLRARNDNVPVLLLTAYDSVQGCISGLDSGADDYMAKPFEVAELEARIRMLLRRNANHKNPLIRCGNLVFDSNSRIFSIGSMSLSLTPKEHALLEALIMRLGKTVSKPALAETLFSVNEAASPNAIEIYVHRLRKKLGESNASIITLRGLGYLLKSHDA